MDGKRVRELEGEIEGVAKVMRRLEKDGSLNQPPSERVVHLMAKAAVAVLEAAEESHERSEE